MPRTSAAIVLLLPSLALGFLAPAGVRRTGRLAVTAPEPWEVELTGAPSLPKPTTESPAGAPEIRDFCQVVERAVIRELLVEPAMKRSSAEWMGDALWAKALTMLGLEGADADAVRVGDRGINANKLLDAFSSTYPDAASWEREDAEIFLSCLLHVVDNGGEDEEKAAALQRRIQPYSPLYMRFTNALRVAGCSLDRSAEALDPKDYNICFSMGDAFTPPGEKPTTTQYLNRVANDVARVLINGADEDAAGMAAGLKAQRQGFLNDYGLAGAEEGTPESDIAWFYDALVDLCESGMATAVALEESSYGRAFCWANSMQRILGLLVQEMGLRLEGSETLEDPIFTRFVNWESELRQNITGNYGWDPTPKDLEGTWCLGAFATSYTTTSMPAELGGEACRVRLLFASDGKGTVKSLSGPDLPLRWSLSPGPTHLDTCSIQIGTSDDNADLFFTGYIDRGQRLETKLSGRSVRMSGRVVRRRKDRLGVDRPMGKFAMTMDAKPM